MNERTLVIVSCLLLVSLVALVLLVVGYRTGKPPGQKGLKGTGLERSPALYRLQMVSLAALLACCWVSAAAVLWR
jgi:hypothetical protein